VSRPVETLRVSLGAIWAHRLRSLLTVLGVVIGVATIITVVSAISGLNGFVREQIFSLSPDVFIVSKFGIIHGRDEFLRAMRRRDLTVFEMERVRELCSTCRDVGASTWSRAGSTPPPRRGAPHRSP
jgi:putative ABC transport system permease protein